jgi:N-acetylglucosaminyldiphosphoundecaprenol N-acetyl-beta-D-mannosaminyltransferase
MQRTGTEWFYRLISEPRRLLKRYTVVNTRFVLLLGRQILSRRPRQA